MSPAARLVLLAALSVGVFLVGVELMVTAVALPQILSDLADWTQLRHASWIVNGYLVAYVAVMPLAGRAADRFSVPALFAGSLVLFGLGSGAAGAAQTLDQLIAARVVQGLGAGAIVPLATAGASHVFERPARARAIGVVSALTFLGMAAGPFLGATVLQTFKLATTNALLEPAWRWIFYLGVPLAIVAAVYTWASAPSWPVAAAGKTRLDVIGAALFTTAVGAGLVAVTTVGAADEATLPATAIALLAFAAWLASAAFASAPFIDVRYFGDRTFTGAVVLSLLTGYALATAIIGGAVFVDRVRYGLADEQQVALGGLAAAVALGALVSGVAVRRFGVVLLSMVGLVLSVAGLAWTSTARPESDLEMLVYALSLFGLGFGLTVTARSTAAVEALGRAAYGIASAGVTVARMIGMGVGLAALTVLGSDRIEALSVVLTDQAARDAVLPPELRGRPLEDYLVVNALESWAADQAAGILSTLFIVAAAVTAVAIVPTLAMRNRPERTAATDRSRETELDAAEGAATPGIAI